MNEQETKERIWKDFQAFMKGQTYSITKKGETNYYEWDIERYCRWS